MYTLETDFSFIHHYGYEEDDGHKWINRCYVRGAGKEEGEEEKETGKEEEKEKEKGKGKEKEEEKETGKG